MLSPITLCRCLSPCSKSKAALKKMKFPAELDLPVNYDKVRDMLPTYWGVTAAMDAQHIAAAMIMCRMQVHIPALQGTCCAVLACAQS